MPSNQTTNYQLSQWAKSDQVKMEDFNADNAKIDAAVKAVDARADGLTQTLAGHTAALSQKGNCQLYLTTYTADGTFQKTLYFPHKPLFVFVVGSSAQTLFAAQGVRRAVVHSGGVTGSADLSWSGNSVSLTNMTYIGSSNDLMTVVALLDAAQ